MIVPIMALLFDPVTGIALATIPVLAGLAIMIPRAMSYVTWREVSILAFSSSIAIFFGQIFLISAQPGGIKIGMGIFIILMAIVIIFTDQIFSLLMVALPDLNISYSYLLIPILIGGFLWQFALLCHKPLEMDQRTKLMVVLMLAALCVNLIGNIVYLPHYGIIATAYTYMASAGVYIIAVIYFSRNKFKIAFSYS